VAQHTRWAISFSTLVAALSVQIPVLAECSHLGLGHQMTSRQRPDSVGKFAWNRDPGVGGNLEGSGEALFTTSRASSGALGRVTWNFPTESVRFLKLKCGLGVLDTSAGMEAASSGRDWEVPWDGNRCLIPGRFSVIMVTGRTSPDAAVLRGR
jgi:hypothetical protein